MSALTTRPARCRSGRRTSAWSTPSSTRPESSTAVTSTTTSPSWCSAAPRHPVHDHGERRADRDMTMSRPRRPASKPGSARRRVIVEDPGSRWPLGRMIATGMATLVALLIAGIVVGALAISSADAARNRVVNVLSPAALHGSRLYSALLNQETGLRGYLLSAQRPYLQPYVTGIADQKAELRMLEPLLGGLPAARADLDVTVRRINSWRSGYAAPAIAQVTASGKPLPGGNIATGKAQFDGVRTP